MGDDELETSARDLPVSEKVARTAFIHPSERSAATILDFYRIAWEYEPTSFPLEWDEEGHVTASFTPDFYLPEFDMYIELTTMNQKLVTKKNRKVRRLKELYPEVSIRVLYKNDFRKLLFKYGIRTAPVPSAEGGGYKAKEPGDSEQRGTGDVAP